MKKAIPLTLRYTLFALLLQFFALAMYVALHRFYSQQTSLLLTTLLAIPCTAFLVHFLIQPFLSLLRAINGTVVSYKDGDYSFSLSWPRQDELGELVAAHNALGDVLRHQRLDLAQRELLLDNMVQHTPVAMLLVCDNGPIVYANVAAQKLLNHGKKLEGNQFDSIVQQSNVSLIEAIQRGGDGLFSVHQKAAEGDDDEEDVYYLARRLFILNGRRHELFLLRQLTNELRRQDVKTWKKVIRVISHELNNSLAPISSLANSARELVARNQLERLPEVLTTIAESSAHLQSFIQSYASFAKLPMPRLETVDWAPFIQTLQGQIRFELTGTLPEKPARFDQAQMQQALLNLLKNAHEAESGAADADHQISLSVRLIQDHFRVEVMDRGSGMSEAVMTHALIPFYSTKRTGTGLGLALAREIIEAHDGRIVLANRAGGGLSVSLIFPV